MNYDWASNGGQPTLFKQHPLRVNKYRECTEIVRASKFRPQVCYQDLGESQRGLATAQESAIIGAEALCGVDRRRESVVMFEHAIGR